MTRSMIALILLSLSTTGAHATGRFQCEATDRAAWLGETQVTERLTAAGWQVSHMKEDGGCWEVYGTDPQNRRVEAYLHPVSGEVQLVSQRGTVVFDIRNANE